MNGSYVQAEQAQRFYLDVKAYAMRFAHLEEHIVVDHREVGMKDTTAHHCKTTWHWGWLRRHKHKESISSLIQYQY